MSRKGSPEEQKFHLGYVVNPKNRIQLYYDEDEYIQILDRAHNMGMKPADYFKLLARPCQSCGLDHLVITKLTSNLTKQYRNQSRTHLFCFVNTEPNKSTTKANLRVSYEMSCKLGIPKESLVFHENKFKYNGENNHNATITIFRDGLRDTTSMCFIKNGVIHKSEI